VRVVAKRGQGQQAVLTMPVVVKIGGIIEQMMKPQAGGGTIVE